MSAAMIGVLTVSDSCASGEAFDKSGPELINLLESEKLGVVKEVKCVADNIQEIRSTLLNWCDDLKLDIVITTGGTGFGPRDITPEATIPILERQAPGLVHCMLAGSQAVTPMAALSRPAAGTRGKTIIINMPGSHKAVKECFGFLKPVLGHALDLIQDKKSSVQNMHVKIQGGEVPKPTLDYGAVSHSCPHHHDPSVREKSSGGPAERPRHSPYPMISVEEAQKIVLSKCKLLTKKVNGLEVLGVETVAYTSALGRILAEDVLAQDPLPPFPASIKDGYAVISRDGPGVRKVLGESSAGYDPSMKPLGAGEVVRINTGAPVPPGADAVVMVENTKLVQASSDGEELEVEILSSASPGLDIRPIGSDIGVGEKVLERGCCLGGGELGVLAAVGVTSVQVASLPTIAILSTGNEVQAPEDKLKPGHIRDSNKTTLKYLLQSKGFSVIDGGIARDDRSTLISKLSEILEKCDLLVTTGGVSMGDRDLLRQVLISHFEAEIHFARVNMKPGKPTTFATCTVGGKTKLILGLPGNPVSATVTCHLYVIPLCKALSGVARPLPGKLRANLQTDRSIKLDPRPEYQRVWLKFEAGKSVGSARNTGNQISSRTTSLAAANGLLILPGRTDQLQEITSGNKLEFDVLLTGDLDMDY